MDLQTKLKRSEQIMFTELDDEIAMMDIESGRYFGVDTAGTRIWQLLEVEKSLQELCSILQDEFTVSAEDCERDVRIFVDELLEHKLVEVLS